jgi:hypothetical protein
MASRKQKGKSSSNKVKAIEQKNDSSSRRTQLEKLTSCATIISAIAAIIAAVGAIYFGIQQSSINRQQDSLNRQLIRMNDVVTLIVDVKDISSGEIMLLNTGKLNLRLVGIRFNSEDESIELVHKENHYPFIASIESGGKDYPIRLGEAEIAIIKRNYSTKLTFFLKDELDRQWVSEQNIYRVEDKVNDSRNCWVRISPHNTYRESWKIQLSQDEDNPDSDTEFIKGAYFIRGKRLKH